jgi:hypothetical protein
LAAAEGEVPIHSVWLRQTGGQVCGQIENGSEPWDVMDVGKWIAHLENLIGEIKMVTDQKSDNYRRLVTDFYTGLRKSWERLVEELLFNGVVGRFQVGVKTQSLKGACVDDSDHKEVYFGMTRASEYSGQTEPEAGRSVFRLLSHAKGPQQVQGVLHLLENPAQGIANPSGEAGEPAGGCGRLSDLGLAVIPDRSPM